MSSPGQTRGVWRRSAPVRTASRDRPRSSANRDPVAVIASAQLPVGRAGPRPNPAPPGVGRLPPLGQFVLAWQLLESVPPGQGLHALADRSAVGPCVTGAALVEPLSHQAEG